MSQLIQPVVNGQAFQMLMNKDIQEASESAIRFLDDHIERRKAQDERLAKIISFAIGQPGGPRLEEMVIAGSEGGEETFRYSNSRGLVSLRRAYAAWYREKGIEIPLDYLIPSVGATGALKWLMALIPGEWMVFAPYYPNYQMFTRETGRLAELLPVPLSIDDGFRVTAKVLERMEEVVSERTRVFLLNNPHNPTGRSFTKKELADILVFCRDHKMVIVDDRVYRDLVFPPAVYADILTMEGAPERTMIVDSLSKIGNDCGDRAGMCWSLNKVFMKQLIKLAQGDLCPPVRGQRCFEAFLRSDRREAFLEEYRGFAEASLRAAESVFRGIPGAKIVPAEAGFYFMAELPIRDATALNIHMATKFSREILDDPEGRTYTAYAAPSELMYGRLHYGRRQMRLACVQEAEEAKLGAEAFAAAIPGFQETEEALWKEW